MNQPFVVSVHIPKTAGTSLAHVFDRCLNRRVIFDYDGYQSPDLPNPDISANARFIETYFAVLHGHFFAKKYFSIFPNAAYIAAIRHPVDRVISQYLHELNEKSSDAWYHNDLISGRMDIVQFAEQPGIGDAMCRHLAGRALPEYDQLIISESLTVSLAIFSRKIRPLRLEETFGSSIPMLNERHARSMTREFGETIKQAIFARTKDDNEIYRESCYLFDLDVMRYLHT